MKKTSQLFLLLLCTYAIGYSQKNPVPSSPTKEKLNNSTIHQKLENASFVNGIPFVIIGPTVMSGRVVDLHVNANNPSHFFVAYASGGLWKTTNNGISFEPLFDKEVVMTIGDIDVSSTNENVIWIGTGESNSSRSSYSGAGLYKSENGGKSWIHKGLEETHHIGKVLIHPQNEQTVFVAAIGHLFSPNKERGVYKTTDDGKTWKQVLFIDENTGAIDLKMDPNNSNVLYAVMWTRERRAWNFIESGKGSGIFKSTDGGESWKKITSAENGFPSDEGTGRIGISVSKQNTNKIYALLDNQNHRELSEEKKNTSSNSLTKQKLKTISKEAFMQLSNQTINDFLDANDFPEEYNATEIKAKVDSGILKPSQLAEYLEDANTLLFDSPVKGAELYLSEDGGSTWKKTHKDYIDGLYNTYGYYFGKIEIDPINDEIVYLLGFQILTSTDNGKTFKKAYGPNVHPDHHALWINPTNTEHLINGNDGGINISYDKGKNWINANTPPVGQIYAIAYDMKKKYNVFCGLQDNGVWYGPNNYKHSMGWHSEGEYPYKNIMGGDGMQIQVDLRDNNTVYTGYQFGNYYRINIQTGEQNYITPAHVLGESPYRWNWQAPILLSRFNEDIVYMGSNFLHRSMNKGNSFEKISGDLTKGGKKGDVSYGTLTAISESPIKFGLLYTGSDDGLIHITKDGGNSWKKISDKLPQDLWVRRIVASAYDEGRVYACLNGHTWDHFNSYLYVSNDFGNNWKKIGTDLPNEPINVVREDPVNKNILYVGTDHGIYVSINRGDSFMKMNYNLPSVAIHDILIHPRDKELIAGTHGRSIYKANVEHLQMLTDTLIRKKIAVFKIANQNFNSFQGEKFNSWSDPFESNLLIPCFVAEKGSVKMEIKTENGLVLFSSDTIINKGINYIQYNFEVDEKAYETYRNYIEDKNKKENYSLNKKASGKYYLLPGKYLLVLSSGNELSQTEFTINKPKKKQRE